MNHNHIKRVYLTKIFSLFLILLICLTINNIGLLNVFAKKYDISDLVFDNSHFVEIDGIHLHYRLWQPIESSDCGNVLLVHGLGGSTFSWRNVVDFLVKEGYSVVAVDLPGFGLSQRKPAVSQSNENRANLIWGLIENIELDGSWHLIGHSLGGGVVATMGLQKPIEVATITLVAGLIDNRNRSIFSLFSKFRFFRIVTAKFIDRFFLSRKRIKSFLTSAYGRKPTTEELEAYYKPLQLEYTYLTLSNLFKRYSSDEDLSEKLNEIRVPVLGLWGSDDDWVPVSKGEQIIKEITNARLIVIEGAKHCPMETHSEIFNRYLLNFLEKDS